MRTNTPAATIAPLLPHLKGKVIWYYSCDITNDEHYRKRHIWILPTKQAAIAIDRAVRSAGEVDGGVRLPHIDWISKGSKRNAIHADLADVVLIDTHRLLA